jgi:hypothetical protein
MLDRYCEKLAKEWEIERGFATNISGMFAIPIGPNQEIVLTAVGGDGITMTSTIGPCPIEDRGELYTKLLAGCTMGQFTKGAVLGLDDKDNITITITLLQSPQYRDFEEAVEDLITTIQTWHELVATAN